MDLHKDKERVRYNKQNELLDTIYDHIPKLAIGRPTKIRKLRHLVIYLKGLQLLRDRVKKSTHNTTNNRDVAVVSKPLNPKYTKIKAVRKKYQFRNRRTPGAHIVFLNPVAHKKFFTDDAEDIMVENYDEIKDSVSSPEPEYKVPDVTVNCQIGLNNTCFWNRDLNEIGIASDECELPSKYVSLNDYVAENSTVRANCGDCHSYDKNNFQLVAIENSAGIVKDCNHVEHSPIAESSKCTRQMIDLHGTSSNASNNYILKDITNFRKEGSLNKKDFLNKFEFFEAQCDKILHGDNYQFPYDSNTTQNSNSPAAVFYSNVVPGELMYFNSGSPLSENVSNKSCTSTSSEKMKIDVENSSDSNLSCNMAENSTSFKLVEPDLSMHSSPCYSDSTANYDLPTAVYAEPHQIENISLYSMPLLSSYNYSESNAFANGICRPMYDIPQSYFNHFYSSGFNANSGNSYLLPPFHAIQDKNTNAESKRTEAPAMFPSTINKDEYFIEPKTENNNPNYSPDSLVEDSIESSLPEEELSCSIAHYFMNC